MISFDSVFDELRKGKVVGVSGDASLLSMCNITQDQTFLDQISSVTLYQGIDDGTVSFYRQSTHSDGQMIQKRYFYLKSEHYKVQHKDEDHYFPYLAQNDLQGLLPFENDLGVQLFQSGHSNEHWHRATLHDLHRHLLKSQYKEKYVPNYEWVKKKLPELLETHADSFYYDDNWYFGLVPLSEIRIHHSDFRGIPLQKGLLLIEQFEALRSEIDSENSSFPFAEEIKKLDPDFLPPIVLNHNDRYYDLIDGQKRAFAACHQGKSHILAYVHL